ncbi:sesquipedalian [Anaeramoeba flamelloides]|uniref:Sesquipedalian n=1 Tax=Anaeramoeba flamelloides TaxID=1746091 RepID=A0ABQ8ZCS8_9EUKA|nr:sesquipedalian [Anaeramoeba flamelloides]
MNNNLKLSFNGFLDKRGQSYHTWHRRFFVLENKSLKYYKKSQSDRHLKGVLDLDHRTRIGIVSSHETQGHKNSFYIRTKKRTLFCSAETKKLRTSWLQNLLKAILSPGEGVSVVFKCPSIKGNEPISFGIEKRITQTLVVAGISSKISLQELHQFLERDYEDEEEHQIIEKSKEEKKKKNNHNSLRNKKEITILKKSRFYPTQTLTEDELVFNFEKDRFVNENLEEEEEEEEIIKEKDEKKIKKEKLSLRLINKNNNISQYDNENCGDEKEKEKEKEKEQGYEKDSDNKTLQAPKINQKVKSIKKIFKTRRSTYWVVIECTSPEMCVMVKNKVKFENYYKYYDKLQQAIKYKFSFFYPRCVSESFTGIIEEDAQNFKTTKNCRDVFVIQPNGTVLRREMGQTLILNTQKVQSHFNIGNCKLFRQFFSKNFVATEVVYTMIPFTYIPKDLRHFTVIINRISKGDKVKIKMETKLNEVDNHDLQSILNFSGNEKIAQTTFRAEKESKLLKSWYDRPRIYDLLKKVHQENYHTSRSCKFLFGLHDFFGHKIDDEFPLQMNEISIQMFNWVSGEKLFLDI